MLQPRAGGWSNWALKLGDDPQAVSTALTQQAYAAFFSPENPPRSFFIHAENR